jgi:putative oxidoreductase
MMSNLDARLTPQAPAALSVFRIVFGLLYAVHGASKLFGWPVGPAVPAGSWPGWWAGLIELIAGLLITVGLFTRPAAFLASGEMAVAYFWQHLPHGFWPIQNQGELAVLYCFAFLLLVFTGPGIYAVETRMGRGRVVTGRRAAAAPPRRMGGWRSRLSRRV